MEDLETGADAASAAFRNEALDDTGALTASTATSSKLEDTNEEDEEEDGQAKTTREKTMVAGEGASNAPLRFNEETSESNDDNDGASCAPKPGLSALKKDALLEQNCTLHNALKAATDEHQKMRKKARESAINSAMIKRVKTSNDKDRNALATQVRNLMKANAQLAQDKAIIQCEL